MLHFAHGGLLVAGLIVTLFIASRTNHGVQGLSLGSFGAAEPSVSAMVDDEPAIEPVAGPPRRRSSLSPDLQRVKAYVAKRYQVSAVALEPLLAAAQTGRSVGVDPLLLVADGHRVPLQPLRRGPMGAQGLMQVIPGGIRTRWTSRPTAVPCSTPTPISASARWCSRGIHPDHRLGGAGPQQYNGSSDPAAPYASKVMAVKAQLSQAARSGGKFVGA